MVRDKDPTSELDTSGPVNEMGAQPLTKALNALFGDRPQSPASHELNEHGDSDSLSGSDDDSSSDSEYSNMLGSEYYDSEDVSELGNHSVDDDKSHGGSGEQTQMNILGMPVLAPTYPEGEFEDNKAAMIAKLMANHAGFVTSSLLERSNLISSITWLSHHVPECVLETLFRTVVKSRKKKAKLHRLGQVLAQKDKEGEAKKVSTGSSGDTKIEEGIDLKEVKMPTAEEPADFSTANIPTIISEGLLPIAKHRDSALLFVDISGFTKLSVMMEVESLSNAINSYFQMIVKEIANCHGDILKFAGDAMFVEWKVSRHKPSRNLDKCVSLAAKCAAAIVANCSDYTVLSKPTGFTANSRRTSLISSSARSSMRRLSLGTESAVSFIPEAEGAVTGEGREKRQSMDLRRAPILGKQTPSEAERKAGAAKRRRSIDALMDAATLNVKCGVGVGHIVGIHVGDDFSRREYLILGDPIAQVGKAEGAASHGEVWASPEAVEYLAESGNLDVAWEEAVKKGRPVRIANRKDCFFHYKRRVSHRESSMSCEAGSMLRCCDDLDTRELEWLKRMISLYVHPVVVNDNNERAAPMRRGSDHDRHLAEAELRNVYTCFITPEVDYKLTGDEEKDSKLFIMLNNIMNLTTRELDRVGGHLRQFILDDKGLVLIGTFGLRGSTFPNMIAQRALPFSLSVHNALEEELGVKSKIGATVGKVYCGVVGGLERHEFAALGPSVNLAARLMASKDNPGVLVDKDVRLLTTQVFFKPLPPVKAKGYDDPVPIFEPIRNAADAQWGRVQKNFVGREKEIKRIMHTAKEMAVNGGLARLLFVSATSGTGKSTLMVNATEHVRAMLKKMQKRVVVTRNISNEGTSSRVPFSMFRSIFKEILSQVRYEDQVCQNRSLDGSRRLENRSLDGSRRLDNSSRYHRLDSSGRDLDGSKRDKSSRGDDFSIDANWDDLSLNTYSSKSSTMSTDATRFRYICQELNAPPEFSEVVGKRLLGLRERNTNTVASNAKPPDMKKVIDFMADAFVRCTRHAHLVLVALDDVQWMDAMSWKVVEAIFERGKNVLILCGSRPLSSYSLTVDPKFWSDLHDEHKQAGRYSEVNLVPFTEPEVHQMIATTLKFEPNEVDSGFSRNIFHTTGGMPHFLSYALDTIGRNQLTVRLENGLIGMKASTENADGKVEFGSVNELLLYRLDALDSSVRAVLHLSAVLGMEFDLLDIALAYEEMFGTLDYQQADTAVSLRSAFDVAAGEGIIEQSYAFVEEEEEDDAGVEEDNLCQSLGTLSVSLKGRKSHPCYTDNPRLRFTHDSWKQSILSVMLDERKQEMHGHIAASLEKELEHEAHNKDDFAKKIRLFKHWKSSGNFTKAALLGLDIGIELMMLGLNTQAILLFDDVLDILITMTDDGDPDDELYGGIGLSVLEAINASELEYLIKVHIAKGKAYATLRQGSDGAEAYQIALDILNATPCADDEGFDRSVSFPIFSGLFAVLKMGAIEEDGECTYEKELCKKFVEQARLNGDPVHYGRALAMEAETLGRLGNFEEALEVVERIKTIYDIATQHLSICKAYGSDRVAQAWTHSVNFNIALGRTEEALQTCDYILEEIVPKSNPKNIHNTFCLIYAIIIALKENGFPLKARDIFKARVIDPFEEHFGPGGSTYSKPMFRPIMTMLDLQGRHDQEPEVIDECTAWALDEEKFEGKIVDAEVAWAAFSASPKAVHSEICFSLSKRQEDSELNHRLLQKAISLMEQSIVTTANLPYPNLYAKKKLEVIQAYEKGLVR